MTCLQNNRIANKMKMLNQPKTNDTKDCWYQYIELIHEENVVYTGNRDKEWKMLTFIQRGTEKTVWLDEIFRTVTEICNIYFYNTEGRDIMADASEIYSKWAYCKWLKKK